MNRVAFVIVLGWVSLATAGEPPTAGEKASALAKARAHRLAKEFDRADELLQSALGVELPEVAPIGPPKLVPGTGWARGDAAFEKEAIYLLEDRAELLDGAPSAKLWKAALDGWSKFMNRYRPVLASGGKSASKGAVLALVNLKVPLPPHPLFPDGLPDLSGEDVKGGRDATIAVLIAPEYFVPQPNGGPPVAVPNPYLKPLQLVIREEEVRLRPLYFEAFCESTRCLARANSSLLKSNPAKLTEQFGKIANTMKDLETKNPELSPEVRAKFADLIESYPDLKKAYVDLQGRMFLKFDPPSEPPTPTPQPPPEIAPCPLAGPLGSPCFSPSSPWPSPCNGRFTARGRWRR